jgi:glycosyltransferase involved in cell wall biosynthesis
LVTTRPLLMPSSYAPHVGGVERVARELATGMSRRGLHPSVFTNQWPKTLPVQEQIDGIGVRRFAFRVPHRSVRGMVGWVAFSAATARAVVSRARDLDSDLVNVHCVSSNAQYALEIATKLDLPLVVSMHGELTCDASNAYVQDRRLRRVWTRLLDAADHITAPSEYSLAEAEAAYGRSFRAPATVAQNGVDLARFTPGVGAPRRDTVFAVGRLVPTKGFDVLLDAWDRMPDGVADNAELVIAGDGPSRSQLAEQARRVRGGNRVRFSGGIDSAAVAEQLASSRLFVLPSRAEAQPLTVLEAMAAGTPIVATRVGGVPELLDEGARGLLVDVDDADSLAAAMADALRDEAAARERAELAHTRVSTMSWDACVDSYLRIYQSVEGR